MPPVVTLLDQHRGRAKHLRDHDFVFATASGRALAQRNVMRELRRSQRRAVDAQGNPTLPALHNRGDDGRRAPVPHGTIPSFDSFRHTAASEAIAAGESSEDMSFLLGHKNSIVTRTVYTQEIRSRESKGSSTGEDERPLRGNRRGRDRRGGPMNHSGRAARRRLARQE